MKPPILLTMEHTDRPTLNFYPRDFIAKESPAREAMFDAYGLRIAVWGPLSYFLAGGSLVSLWNDLKLVNTHDYVSMVAPIMDFGLLSLFALVAYRATSTRHLKEESTNGSN